MTLFDTFFPFLHHKDIMGKIILIMLCSILTVNAQYSNNTNQVCKQHNQQIIKNLKPDNPLYSALERNETGNGIFYSWMNKMQLSKVKQATAVVDFELRGQEVKLSVREIIFYNRYDYFGSKARIKNVGNDKQTLYDDLKIPFFNEALRTIEGFKIKNNNCGKLYLNLLDDACLPITYNTETVELGCSKLVLD
jgi:hypothetical protein